MSTVVGVFSERGGAERALRALKNEGFSEEKVSILARDESGRGGGEAGEGTSGRRDFEAGDLSVGTEDIGEGVAWGGGLGAAAGLLAGVGALAVPGIGPILAAGPLAAALSGAVAGGIAGGLLDLGIPEEEGKRFEEHVKQGRVLAVVETENDEKAKQAQQLLQENGADEVKTYGAK